MKAPRLTLCMIARDEADHLDACLASVRGLVDSIVVVDTGSVDGTQEIAERHGARVIEHAWDDDFAAARNVGLRAVRCGFILVLDADERLTASGRRAVKQAVREMHAGGIGLGLLPLHHADGLDANKGDVITGARRHGEVAWLPRLLRRDDELAYEGCVHESVGRWASGREATLVPAPIVHYGGFPQLRADRGKDARNLRLLERRVAEHPSDAVARAYLARELQRAGNSDGAMDQARRAWQNLEHALAAGDDCDVVLPASLHAEQCLAAGARQEAQKVLERALAARRTPHSNLVFLLGVCEESAALEGDDAAALERAAKRYAWCLAQADTPVWEERMDGVCGWQAELRLGTVALQRSDPRTACDAFARALQQKCGDVASELGRAEARIALGELADARAALDALEPEVAASADAKILRARLAKAAGELDSEREWLDRARLAADESGWIAPHRRRLLQPAPIRVGPAASAPELSVIVTSYQRCETLMRCIDRFEAQDLEHGRFEMVIVNDGSTDGTRERLDARTPRVPTRVIHQRNGGIAAARNAALDVARGEFVLFVNDDTMPDPDLIERHLAAHRASGDPALAVLGSFVQPGEVLQRPLMRALEANHMVFCFVGMQAGALYDWTRFWTCNVSVRADAVAAVGGFDEEFRHYGAEDTELAIRLTERGMRVLYEPRARAVHEHVLTLEELESRSRFVARAWVRLFRKHPSALQHPDWRWVQALSRRACDDYVEPRRLHAALWRLAIAQVADVDLREAGRARGSAGVGSLLQSLEGPLAELHRYWWHEGLGLGLEEQGAEDFDALIRTDAPRGDRASRGFVAWPRYGTQGELEALFEEYGPALADRDDATLVLVHDPGEDGPADVAMAELERAYARSLDGAELDVFFYSEALSSDGIAVLRERANGVLALESEREPARSRLFAALDRPRIRDGATLLDALG